LCSPVKASIFQPIRATKSNPSLCTKFDAPQTASRIRGDPIGIARVVVVRRTVSVDIAEIVRVASIDRTQPPIRRGFYQDVTVVGNYY